MTTNNQQDDKMREMESLLHEGLDLCVRARKLDEQVMGQVCRELGSYREEHMNCGTAHLWVQEQYEKDVAEWEEKTRKALGAK